MSNNLVKTFDQYVTSQKIAIAVSGGIDSMVLMKISSLSKKIKSISKKDAVKTIINEIEYFLKWNT